MGFKEEKNIIQRLTKFDNNHCNQSNGRHSSPPSSTTGSSNFLQTKISNDDVDKNKNHNWNDYEYDFKYDINESPDKFFIDYQNDDDPFVKSEKSLHGPDDPRFTIEPSAWKRPLKWSNVILLSILHIGVIISYYHVSVESIHFRTYIFALLIGALSGVATSAGSHRLWSHRSYKARWPLSLFYLIFQAITMNGSALTYARDHRTHHKYSDTEGDPKNPTRGLFYSHIGWWLVKKTDSVKRAGSKLDFSDLYQEKLVYFQHKYYVPIFIFFGVILPTWIPVHFWNEKPSVAFSVCVVLRIFVILHHLFTVNSLAHYFGYRPFDFRIRPADHRVVNYISFGEGIHNYHHVFPFDYRINDQPQWQLFNPPIMFIHLCHRLGLAYDLKIATPSMVKEVVKKRGVKAIYDKNLNLPFRILNSIFDWTCGILMAIWISYPPLIYKYMNNMPLFKE